MLWLKRLSLSLIRIRWALVQDDLVGNVCEVVMCGVEESRSIMWRYYKITEYIVIHLVMDHV